MLHSKYFEVIKSFLGDYSKEIYGRELVGKVSLSQKAISLVLNELEEEGVLSSNYKGKIKYYSLNFLNPLIKEYISLFEKEKSINFLEKNQKFIDFFNKLDFECVVIFGSYAKGSFNKNSDLDLFLVGKVDTFEVVKIGESYNLEVHVFSSTKKEFSGYFSKLLGLNKEILDNHIIIRGESVFIEEVLKCRK
jgi:predicted nucleotidyltransferase